MTDPAVIAGELDAEALAAYRTLCAREGVDPDIELATARLATGHTSTEWITVRLGRDQFPDAGIGDGYASRLQLSGLIGRGGAPDHLWWVTVNALHRPAPRFQLVMRPNCPVRVLTALAADPTPGLRSTVATRPNTPIEIVRLLTADPNTVVAAAAHDQLAVRS